MTSTAIRTAAGLWKSSHPGPTLVVTALAAGLSVAAELELWRTTVLTVAVCAGQLSIGISNDTMDAQRDRAVGRTEKPLARNEVSTATGWAQDSPQPPQPPLFWWERSPPRWDLLRQSCQGSPH